MKENNLGNYLFSFQSQKVDCVIDVSHHYKTSIKENFKFLEKDDEPITYTFVPEYGLATTNESGSIVDKNILAKLISIDETNNDEIRNFFEKYGYFFKVHKYTYLDVPKENLVNFIKHLRTIVELVSQINDSTKRDYESMLNKMLYLIFQEPITLPVSGKYENTNSTKTIGEYNLKEIFDYSNLPGLLIDEIKENNNQDFEFNVIDPIYNNQRSFTSNGLLNSIKDIDSYDFAVRRYKKEIFNYAYNPSFDDKSFKKYLLAFLINLQEKRGAIIETKGYLTTYNRLDWKKNDFDSNMKDAMVYICKKLVAADINQNLTGIIPIYDFESMEPHWKVNNLLSALYFSLFYQKPGQVLWRRCANPNCNNFFTVDRSSSRRKYCPDSGCGNACRQARYRQNNK